MTTVKSNLTNEAAGYKLGGMRMGWKESEEQLLWDEVSLAREQGRALKHVFETVARKTGRKPNSIRNYYYARIKASDDRMNAIKNPAFVPFSEEEIRMLLETVLGEQAKGVSVRACTLQMGNGDNKAMLRYQNKYRSLIKTNPELVNRVMEEMRQSGIAFVNPYEQARRSGRAGRPRSRTDKESLVEVLGGVVAELGRVEGLDVTAFFESLGALAISATKGAEAQHKLKALKDASDSADVYLELQAAQEKQFELTQRLDALTRQFEAQKDRFATLMGLFRQLMSVNREFLGLNSVIKVSNLSSYIRDLSRSVEDCEKLLIDVM